ncbi:CaiB/BaiF CoA transferase family protein [Rhodopila sp.]|uniref:CaiB/BaiF CoA transferase family protein n=1 Tax=Rhodopila sp. TaxID=2480087 RepID=UPI002C381ECE|nr:CoA transferase [Rhodopila sp.]HVZ07980.1 CoA transferase [Rhodopila sp.]
MPEKTRTGPLHGIRVLEIGQALAGPLAGVIMADMGAEVIKVEKPDGGDDARLWGPPFVGGDSVMFHNTNRGKKSVTLDIKDSADVAKLKKLAAESDILIQNLRPGIVDDFGIGPEALTAEFPRLIYCSIWAFGHTGPLKRAPGFDPLLQSYGAVVTLTGRPEDPPTFCAPAINDTSTGMWCVIGALAALQRRAVTGRGGIVDASLFESAVAWVQGPLNNYNVTGKVPARHGAASATLAPYQIFETKDRPVCIAAGNDRLFVKLAKAMGHPEWCDDPLMKDGRQRAANREYVVAAMQPVLLTRTRQDWLGLIGEAGVPCAPVNDIAELARSEQLHAMDMLRTLPGSGLSVVGLPISFERERPYPAGDSPTLGQHNAEVFKD